MGYITTETIKALREAKAMTQKELAELLGVSDKTISKWETSRGLPDISIVEGIAKALGVSLLELFTRQTKINTNYSGNMKRAGFYVCPICGNVMFSLGEGAFSCCVWIYQTKRLYVLQTKGKQLLIFKKDGFTLGNEEHFYSIIKQKLKNNE